MLIKRKIFMRGIELVEDSPLEEVRAKGGGY